MDDQTVAWSEVAGAWDHNAEFVEAVKEPLTERLLDRLDLHSGDRVLELGAGTGLLGRRLADLVGPTGRVIVSDAAAGMVDVARRRLEGHPGVEVVQLDANATGLPDGSQDAVVLRMALMLVDDPVATMTEVRRLLARPGRTGVAVWAGPEHNPWLSNVGMAAMVHGLVSGGPPTGPGGIFSLADPDVLRKTIEAAGFDDIAVESVELTVPFGSLDDYFAFVSSMSGPLASALASASAEQLSAVRRTVGELAGRFDAGGGRYELPARAHLAVARV